MKKYTLEELKQNYTIKLGDYGAYHVYKKDNNSFTQLAITGSSEEECFKILLKHLNNANNK